MPNANWSNPQLTSTYTNFVSEVKNRDEDLALQFDGTTSTNLPTNTIRWDSSANRWKKWNGTSWAELASTYALTALSTTGAATIGTTLGVTGAITGSSTVTGTALIPSGSSIPVNGVYLPSANSVAIATNSAQRLAIDSSGNISIPGALSTTGSNTAASFIPTSSTAPTNGVYLPAANSVAISTNGTGRLFVDASGRVGVGTSVPDRIFHVSGAVSYPARLESSGPNVLLDFKTSGSGAALSTAIGVISDAVVVNTNSTERFRITSAGLVGVGTSAPQAELNVAKTGGAATVYIESDAGNNATTSILRFGGASGRSASIQGFRGASSNVHSLDFYTYNSADVFGMRLTPTGLGIGNSVPGSFNSSANNLVVGTGAGNEGITIYGGSDGQSRIDFKDSADTSETGIIYYNHASDALIVHTAGSERARIDSSGRLLVGTSTAAFSSSYLTVKGGVSTSVGEVCIASTGTNIASGDDIGAIRFTNTNGARAAQILATSDGTWGTNDYPGRLSFSTTADGAASPTERFRIGSAGQLGIGGATYGTAGQVLTSGGASAAPTWSTSSGTPAGAVDYFAMSSAPTGYLKANGAAISRSTYSDLFTAIGTTFGVGDGSTTFNVPDLRGEFIRGWDDSRGVDSGRVFGSTQADDFESHTHSVSNISSSSAFMNTTPSYSNVYGGGSRTTNATGGTETRPRNIALLACIKF